MLRRVAALFVVLTLLAPAAVEAFSQRGMKQWRDIAQSEMRTIWQRLKAERGFGYAGDMVVGSLQQGGHEYFEFDFVKHREYVIKGICDGDCGDIDLYLYNRRNDLVQSNTRPGAGPAIQLGTGYDGRYKIQTSMASCSVEPCYYAVQVFHKYGGN